MAEEVAVLVARHAPDIFAAIEVVSIEHLLDRFDSPSEETAYSVVFSLAVLTECAASGRTLIDDVSPLVALVADCPLRTSLAGVGEGEAEETAGLVETGIFVVAHLFAPKTAHVALEIPIHLRLSIRLRRLLTLCFTLSLSARFFDFGHQVGCLCASELVTAEQLVGVYWSLYGHLSLEDIIAVDDLECGASLGELLQEFFDE